MWSSLTSPPSVLHPDKPVTGRTGRRTRRPQRSYVLPWNEVTLGNPRKALWMRSVRFGWAANRHVEVIICRSNADSNPKPSGCQGDSRLPAARPGGCLGIWLLCRMCSSRPTARHASRPTPGRRAVPAGRPHHSSGRAWGNASRETGGGAEPRYSSPPSMSFLTFSSSRAASSSWPSSL